MATFSILLLQFVTTLTTLKILSNKRSKNLYKFLLIILICIVLLFLPRTIGPVILLIFTYCMSFYYHKEIVNTIYYGSVAMIVVLISDHIAFYIDVLVFKYIPQMTDNKIIVHLCIYFLLAISFAFVISKLLQSIVSIQVKTFMSFLGFTTVLIYFALIYGMFSLGTFSDLIEISLFFFVLYLVLSIVTFGLYATHLKKQNEIKLKEDEFESQKKYLNEIEKQYQNMRKFRHDYQNLLIPIEIFIVEEDMSSLKKYYESVLKPTSKYIDNNNFKLENLSKIKIRELKSLFASKLLLAQEQGINAKFEANTDIDELPIDTYTLITSIGILLDNAIEELEHNKGGSLLTGLLKDDDLVTIIIQNSCRNNLPKLHLLKQAGFSTKGKNRGLGLSNLHEMLSPLNHVTTETTIRDNYFIQIIYIQLGE